MDWSLVITGMSLTAMWTCVAHTGYLVTCAVLLTFLRCPGFSRATLLLCVPLNAVAEVNQQPALDLMGLTLLLLTLSLGINLQTFTRQIPVSPVILLYFSFHFLSAGHWVVNQLWACLQIRGKPAAPLPLAPCDIVEPQKQPVSSCHSYPQSSTPQKWVCRPHCILCVIICIHDFYPRTVKCLVKFPRSPGNIFKMFFVWPSLITLQS